MKAAILAGGLGKRLLPLTRSVPKPLVFVGGKTMIEWGLEALSNVGLREVGIVVSPFTSDAVGSRLRGWSQKLNIRYFLQEQPMGTAHAVSKLTQFAEDDVLVISSDVLVEEQALAKVMEVHERHKPLATILGVTVKEARMYGVMVVRDGILDHVEEKPSGAAASGGALVNSGVYALSAKAVSLAGKAKLSPRGEMEITETFNELAKLGEVRVVAEEGDWWRDVGTFPSLLEANSLLLKKGKGPGYYPWGRFSVGDLGVVNGPSFVSPSAVVAGVVGPEVSADDGVVVRRNARVSSSILMAGCEVGEGAEVENAVVAPGAVVKGKVKGSTEEPAVVARLFLSPSSRSCKNAGLKPRKI